MTWCKGRYAGHPRYDNLAHLAVDCRTLRRTARSPNRPTYSTPDHNQCTISSAEQSARATHHERPSETRRMTQRKLPLTPSPTFRLLECILVHRLLREIPRLDLHPISTSPPRPQSSRLIQSKEPFTFASISTRLSAGISSSGISYRFSTVMPDAIIASYLRFDMEMRLVM